MTSNPPNPLAPAKPGLLTPVRRLMAIFALALTLLGTVAVVAPEEASAHVNGHQQCLITKTTDGWRNIKTTVTNNCAEDLSIKIDRRFPFSDSGCYWVRSGEVLTWNQGWWGTLHATGKPC